MNKVRKILYVSGSRADYGPIRDLLWEIDRQPNFDLSLLVTAMHLKSEHGMTRTEIERDGFHIAAQVETGVEDGKLVSMSTFVGRAMIGIAEAIDRQAPDILLLLGDRAEQLSAAVAGAIQNVTIAHLCGGTNSGSIDGSFRHAISKFAHYHLPASQRHADRLIQLGEQPETIHVVGLPGGHLGKHVTHTPEGIRNHYGLPSGKPYLLVLQHPVTHSHKDAECQIRETLDAVVEIGLPTLLANPNGDPGGTEILDIITSYASIFDELYLLPPPADRELFASVMAHSAVLIGNSSSAVYEAMSVGLPVVNIGDRQFGRENESVWINVGYNRQEIVDGIRAAMFDEAYRSSLRKYSSAIGAYNPEVQVAKILAGLDLSRSSHPKKFFDIVPEKG